MYMHTYITYRARRTCEWSGIIFICVTCLIPMHTHSLTHSQPWLLLLLLPFQPTLCVRHTRESPHQHQQQHCNNSSSTLTLIISALSFALFGSRRSVFIFSAPSSATRALAGWRTCNCAPRAWQCAICAAWAQNLDGDASILPRWSSLFCHTPDLRALFSACVCVRVLEKERFWCNIFDTAARRVSISEA